MTMETFFQLIDLSSGNVVGEYDDKPAALADLRDALEKHGVEHVSDYSLLEISASDQLVVAMRDDLIRLAMPSVQVVVPCNRRSAETGAGFPTL
jgi:hypothetical protein